MIKIGCLKWQVSVASKSLCNILCPKAVYMGKAGTTDKFVLHIGSAAMSCAVVDWEQNISANMWPCVIWQPEG